MDDAEIDADAAVEVEAGRGQGLDWERSLTFDTGKEVSASPIDIIAIVLHRAHRLMST